MIYLCGFDQNFYYFERNFNVFSSLASRFLFYFLIGASLYQWGSLAGPIIY